MSHNVRFLCAAVLLAVTPPLAGQWQDATEQYALTASTQASWLGCGMSLADYDSDGLGDVTLADSQGFIYVYRQEPNGGFVLAHLLDGSEQAQGLAWMDVDGDEDLDLLVTRRFGPIELHIVHGENLINEAALRGFPQTLQWESRGLAVADYDNDGDLDVYLSMYHDGSTGQVSNLLLNNDGLGFFANVTAVAGVGNGLTQTFQSTWWDHDEDGDMDLWVVNDRQQYANALYDNQGDGTFVDLTEATGLGQAVSARSATIGDVDNDGVFELFSGTNGNEPNVLLDKEGAGYFCTAALAGVNGGLNSWGSCFLDMDGDMWQDLMVATNPFPLSQPYENYLYLNDGDGSSFSLIDFESSNSSAQLFCVGITDVNQDLAPDLVGFGNPTSAQVWHNTDVGEVNSNNRLTVRLCGTASNRWAVGARIEVHAGGQVQTQLVSNGSDFMTQQSETQFFGLGQEDSADSIVVHWPSGLRETWFDWPANASAALIEGTSNASISVLGSSCATDSAVAFSPFDAPITLWNGEPVEGIGYSLTESETVVLSCQWMGGLFEWSDTLVWAAEAPHELTVGWTEPDCAGELGNLTWQTDSTHVAAFLGFELTSNGMAETYGGVASLTTINTENGCEQVHDFHLAEPPPLGLYILYEPPLCHDDVAEASASGFGGTPAYLINWYGVNPSIMPEGSVPLTLTDANGCALDSSILVAYPEPLSAEVIVVHEDDGGDASISLELSGGTLPYGILWNDGTSGEFTLNNLSAGLYSWVVEDGNGCLMLGLQSLVNLSHETLNQGQWSWAVHAEGATLMFNGSMSPNLLCEIFGLDGRLQVSKKLNGSGPWEFEQGRWPEHGFIRLTRPSGEVLMRRLY